MTDAEQAKMLLPDPTQSFSLAVDDVSLVDLRLDAATKKFESMFSEVLTGLPSSISQTGEEYIEVGNDGIRDPSEGSTVYDFVLDKRVAGKTIHPTAADAIDQWLQSAVILATPLLKSKPALYWRIKPEIDFGMCPIHAANGLFLMPTWQVYSRFLISDKPALR